MKPGILLFLLSGCATPAVAERPLTISEVWARHHELDGKIIRVEGTVYGCSRWGCPLKEAPTAEAKWLSPDSTTGFDAAAKTYLGRKILVEGRFDATCLHFEADDPKPRGDVIVCADGGTTLYEPKLIGPAQ